MTDYRGTQAYLLIYAELIAAARHRGMVTYQELADLVGLPLMGNHMGRMLGEYLGAISQDETSNGRPMLSALVSSSEGTPGPGFFGLAKDIGRLKSEESKDRARFWEAEKKAAYAVWRKIVHEPPVQ
jgi:hypothetical protein